MFPVGLLTCLCACVRSVSSLALAPLPLSGWPKLGVCVPRADEALRLAQGCSAFVGVRLCLLGCLHLAGLPRPRFFLVFLSADASLL
jgi:hypothetical protein